MWGFLTKVGNRLGLGIAVTLGLMASLVVFFMGAVAVAWALVYVTTGETGDDQAMEWVKLTAILWVPLAIGCAMPGLVEAFGPGIRDRRELERSRDLGRFVEKAGRSRT